MSGYIQTHGRDTITKDAAGNKVTRVGGTGSIVDGLIFDDVQATYPSSLVEEYRYYLNSVLLTTVTITYQDAEKCIFLRAMRVDV